MLLCKYCTEILRHNKKCDGESMSGAFYFEECLFNNPLLILKISLRYC